MQPAGPGADAAGRCNAIHGVQADIKVAIASTAFQAHSPAMSNAFCQAGAMLLLPMQGDFLKWTKRKLPVQLKTCAVRRTVWWCSTSATIPMPPIAVLENSSIADAWHQ